MKKLNRALNIMVALICSAFTCWSVYVFVDYKINPDEWAMESAPWYTSILLYGIFAAIIIVVIFIVKLIIRRK